MTDTTSDPYAELARDVETALRSAGLSVVGEAGTGVGVDVAGEGHDHERVVMLTWASEDQGDEVRVMLPAVAEVLRTRGFAVERHPIGAAFIVTGRVEAGPSRPGEDYAREAVAVIRRAVNTERDFPGWLAAVLATVAAGHEHGSHALTAGRPGSWEADHLGRLLAGTVGEDDEMLSHYAAAPGGPREE
jgi:hypothetical protein